MRVEDKQSLKGTDAAPAKSAGDKTAVRPQADKVSLDGAKQVEAIVQAVQTSMGVDRSARGCKSWKPPSARAATSPMLDNWRKRSCKRRKSMPA
jgi:hypothetical protein